MQRSDAKVVLTCLIPAALFPICLLLINDSWAFLTPGNWIDPYIYTGYFFNLRQLLSVFPSYYYGTRLPWLLLGYLTHISFAPLQASYVLRLVLIYSSTFSLFLTLYLVFRNAAGAAMAALTLSAHSYFLFAVGWDYVDGVGIALILMTTASLTVSARTRYGRIGLISAGLCQCAMASTYIVLLLMVPFQLWWYAVLSRSRPLSRALSQSLFLAAGWLIGLASFGLANKALSGRFLFFVPQLAAAFRIGGDPGRWKEASYAWVQHATWLLFPAIAMTAGAAILSALAGRRKLKEKLRGDLTGVQLCAAQLVVLGATFLVLEIRGYWLLQLSFYASYLIPAVFLLIGSVFAVGIPAWKNPRAPLFVSVTGMVLAACYAYAGKAAMPMCSPNCHMSGPISLFAVGAALAATATVLYRSVPWACLTLMLLAPMNVAIADRRVFSFPPSRENKARALMVYDGILAVRPYNNSGNMLFWYNLSEPLGGVFRGIASAYMWSDRLVSENFPARKHPETGEDIELKPGAEVAILSSQDDVLGQIRPELTLRCASAEPRAVRTIQRGSERYTITLLRVGPLNPGPQEDVRLETAQKAAEHSRVSFEGGRTIVETSPTPWFYAAVFPIPDGIRQLHGGDPAVIRVNLDVSGNPLGVGVLNAHRTSFLSRVAVRPSPAVSEVMLSVPKLAEASEIVIETWNSGAGVARIHSLRVQPYSCPAP